MLVFAASDKGGTGRSVTSCNVAYHLAQRCNVAYLDFDFGSPTAGAIFEISSVERGTERSGLHSFVEGTTTDPAQVDVWLSSGRRDLRTANTRAGRLVLFPGDRNGAEFPSTPRGIARCVELFSRLEREFDVCFVDLSAGRSHAVNMALHATAHPTLRSATARWLVFHRWTRQHIVAAGGLVHGARGILDVGADAGHDKDTLEDAIRFVRTAVPTLDSPLATDRPAQATWLTGCDAHLNRLAQDNKLGRSRRLGSTPVEHVLQWREQLISDADVAQKIADSETVDAFRTLARKVTADAEWEGL